MLAEVLKNITGYGRNIFITMNCKFALGILKNKCYLETTDYGHPMKA